MYFYHVCILCILTDFYHFTTHALRKAYNLYKQQ